MSICETAAYPGIPSRLSRNGAESRSELACELWMLDHDGSTVLRCRCLESTSSGLRLRVPLGYGVGVGQRYEVRSHLPGQRPTAGASVIGSAWITIVHLRILLTEDADHLDVHAVRDPLEDVLRLSAQPPSPGESPAAL